MIRFSAFFQLSAPLFDCRFVNKTPTPQNAMLNSYLIEDSDIEDIEV